MPLAPEINSDGMAQRIGAIMGAPKFGPDPTAGIDIPPVSMGAGPMQPVTPMQNQGPAPQPQPQPQPQGPAPVPQDAPQEPVVPDFKKMKPAEIFKWLDDNTKTEKEYVRLAHKHGLLDDAGNGLGPLLGKTYYTAKTMRVLKTLPQDRNKWKSEDARAFRHSLGSFAELLSDDPNAAEKFVASIDPTAAKTFAAIRQGDERLAQGGKRIEETARHNKIMEGQGWDRNDLKRMTIDDKRYIFRQKHLQAMHSAEELSKDVLHNIGNLKRLYETASFVPTTGPFSQVKNVPILGGFTNAAHVDMYLDSLVNSQLAKLALQESKANSPNGASGFGNLSNREFMALGQAIASLNSNMRPEEFMSQLSYIEQRIKDAMTLREASDDEINKWMEDNTQKSRLRDGARQEAPTPRETYSPDAPPMAAPQPQEPAPQAAPQGGVMTPEQRARLQELRAKYRK